MSLQPFTPAGVQLKLKELYALSTSALQEQSEMVASDLKTWMAENFELNADQQSFLSTLNSNFCRDLGRKISVAMDNKLPITLEKPGDPPIVSKFITTHDSSQLDVFQGEYIVSGGLTVTIGTRP